MTPLEDWRAKILEMHPEARFVLQDRNGNGYGRPGDWTALVGFSPLTDIVGIFTATGDCATAEGSLRLQLQNLY
jgi:hypothetical protein